MGSRRIKKNADQNIDRDEEASSAKKCLQKLHFRSHPLVDACNLGRPRFQRSSRSAELAPSRHTPAADLVAPTLGHTHVMTLVTIGHASLSVPPTLRTVTKCRDACSGLPASCWLPQLSLCSAGEREDARNDEQP